MRAQRLADSGYVVLKCDNRGSSRRGLAFEGAIKHDMGHLEIVDQATAVNYFVSKGIVDPARVGIYGWSYGVSREKTCMHLSLSLTLLGIYVCHVSLQIFCLRLWSLWCPCHVLGSVFRLSLTPHLTPFTDGYDSHYTERYMGRPVDNSRGYFSSDVMNHVTSLTGKLLLIHGGIDENVHFRHTSRLIAALTSARKR